MQPNRRPLALATLVSLVAVLTSAAVLRHVEPNVELGEQNDVREAVAAMGIEGEADIPLPIA